MFDYIPLADDIIHHIRDGRFQRSLSLIAGLSGILSGIEVTLEHYKGSYSRRIMYSPLICSLILGVIGIAGALSPMVARVVLPWASLLLMADGVVGFGFHIRGIARKPGGWTKNLVVNIITGPPLFAPLLLGIGGWLGIIASLLLPENAPNPLSPEEIETLRKYLAIATLASAFLNGFEVIYSHYQARFSNLAQWIPVVLTPFLMVTAGIAIASPEAAHNALTWCSELAVLSGAIGMFFHIRKMFRMPGGARHFPYNIIYGPPPLAPLLFAATGFLGLLTVIMGGKG